MKKKVLFLIGNLESGGVSKSMVNLLNVIDRQRYDISLFVFNPQGLYYDMLPNNGLTILVNPQATALVQGSGGLGWLFRKGYYLLTIGSLIRMIVSLFSKAYSGWILAQLIPPIKEEFDVIIDYNGQHQLYYMVDKLQATRKITFFHTDYTKWSYYYQMDKKYFPKVEYICSISEHCVQSLRNTFPKVTDKILLVENISSSLLIEMMSEQLVNDIDESRSYIFATLGHLCERKGTDIAIDAARILQDKGYDFIWYFIGLITDEKYIKMVEEYGLSDKVKCLGLRSNPYPYLNKADLYIHPSQFEGKSIALDEAKLLCKPIVVTNFSTVHDQFIDRVNASICEMNSKSLAEAIEELMNNESLKNSYLDFLRKHKRDNTSEVEKYYRMIDKMV